MNVLKDFIIWLVGTVVLGILLWVGIKFSIGFLTFISIVALIFFQIIGIVSLTQLKDDKKQKKEEQNYNNNYITTKELNDERYGKIIIKCDANKHQYEGEIKNIKFNGQLLNVNIEASERVSIEKMLDNLKAFCNKESVILDRVYKEMAETLKQSDNFDKEGNLIEITEQFLKENFKFDLINLYDEEIVDIWGSWEDSGNQDYAIRYNITKDSFEFELL